MVDLFLMEVLFDFSDYCKNAIRLSAMMKRKIIYVLTHDSIGLGEDDPTHQPIEQLAGLRAIPNLNVFSCAMQLRLLSHGISLKLRKHSFCFSIIKTISSLIRNSYNINKSSKGIFLKQKQKF